MGVARSPDDVMAELLALLAPGWAINSDPDGMVANFLAPLAVEISRFESFAQQQLVEVDPRVANYLLPDYQRVIGPDPYGRDLSDATTGELRQVLYQLWTRQGGQSPGYFIGLAALLGMTITITERRTAASRRSICGDDRCAPSPTQFIWIVTMPATLLETSRSGACVSGAAFTGGVVTANPVQAAILQDAPAHTQPVFSYTG